MEPEGLEPGLTFFIDPELDPGTVAALRQAVGWDGRREQITRAAAGLYFRAACFAGDRLAGYVEVISDRVDDAYIRNLIVHPDYQRRGIGLRLLQIVTARIKAAGIKTINVLFEPELAPFYRRAGFTIIAGGLIDNEQVDAERLAEEAPENPPA